MIISIAAALVLALAYLAPIVPPDKFWPLAFFGLAYPFLLLLNVILLVLLAIVRSKKIVIPLVAILLGFNHLITVLSLFPHNHDEAKGIKVISYNVQNFKADSRKKKDEPLLVLDFLKKSNADIICLQEANLSQKGRLSPAAIKTALPNINSYQLAHGSSFSGPVTFSKYPIINLGEIRFRNSSNMVLFSDIKMGNGKIIRVYNCHFQSNMIAPGKYSLIDSEQDDLSRKQIGEAKELGLKLRRAYRIRAEQARKVAAHIRQSKYPVIVCGDFNDTPVSYVYSTVSQGLKDAFAESGFGISSSYNGIIPSLRIDYILHDKRYEAVNYKRYKVKYSDHFPISCTLIEP